MGNHSGIFRSRRFMPVTARPCGVLAVLVCLILSCVSSHTGPASAPSAYVKNGKIYGTTKGAFRHRWWNYYERGCSFAEGGFAAEAEADFREALRQRTGDQRMARTYGMHFVDYFPLRELGVVYLGQGRVDEAIEALETSIGEQRSAKAEFYLDEARKARLEKTDADRSAPWITITSPESGALLTEFGVRVTGAATDDTFVKEIAVNGIPVRIDLAAPEVPFSINVPLTYGSNTILVTATDLVGKVTVEKLPVYTDRTGPAVGLEAETLELDEDTGMVAVKGTVRDESGIRELYINGETLGVKSFEGRSASRGIRPVAMGDNLLEWVSDRLVRFNRYIRVKTGTHHVTLEAVDNAGNRTRAVVSFAASLRAQRPLVLASRDDAVVPGQAVIAAAAAPPFIELENVEDGRRSFSGQLYLEVRVVSEIGVKSIRVNGRPVATPMGKNVFFGHLVPLKKGENRIVVTAEATDGGVAEKTVRVYRNSYSIDENTARLSVAVLPFEQKGIQSGFASGVYERVFDAVFDSNRFDLVERQQLDAILREQKLSATALVDQGTAIEVGGLVAAAGLVAGSVLETEASMEIYARLIDVESTQAMATVDVYGEPMNAEKIRTLCKGLSLKLADALPREEGVVVKAKGRRILVDMGADKGIRTGMRLVLFTPPEDELDDTTIVARARITSVKAKTAVAELTGDDAPDTVAVMTKVITQ